MLIRKALILSLFSLASSQGNIQPTTTISTGNQPLAIESRQLNVLQDVAETSSSFALDMLVIITDLLHSGQTDFFLSPLAIWSLLLPCAEGAGGNTLTKMRSVLRLNEERSLALSYCTVKDYLRLHTPSVQVSSMQAILFDKNKSVNQDYQKIIEDQYDAKLLYPIDFLDRVTTAAMINDEVRIITNNLIKHAVLPQDFLDDKLLLISSLVFNGEWKSKFNESMTRITPFYDEDGSQIGNVEMMVQIGRFHYTGVHELEGHVLELPYGEDDRITMLMILPKRGVSLRQVASNLKKTGIAPIFKKLVADTVTFEDEEVEIFVPKFTSKSDLNLSTLLYEMGASDLFGWNANFTKIDSDLSLGNILHSSMIIVNEKGTTAAGGYLINRVIPSQIIFDRPFLYMVVEKQTNVILFYGSLMKPKNSSVK